MLRSNRSRPSQTLQEVLGTVQEVEAVHGDGKQVFYLGFVDNYDPSFVKLKPYLEVSPDTFVSDANGDAYRSVLHQVQNMATPTKTNEHLRAPHLILGTQSIIAIRSVRKFRDAI